MMPDSHMRLVPEAKNITMEDLDDDDLFLLVKTGRKDAFEALIGRHQRLVLGLAIRFLGDRALGRDVAQDVFLALWSERMRYQPRGKFRSYLVSMTTNRCNYAARQRASHTKKLSNLATEEKSAGSGSEAPLSTILEREKSRALRNLIQSLPPTPRQVMILRYTNDMSLEEIATATGMPIGTVKSHLCRGVKRLHELWSKEAS